MRLNWKRFARYAFLALFLATVSIPIAIFFVILFPFLLVGAIPIFCYFMFNGGKHFWTNKNYTASTAPVRAASRRRYVLIQPKRLISYHKHLLN
jgi:ABC-type phosphate transport system permease subunit